MEMPESGKVSRHSACQTIANQDAGFGTKKMAVSISIGCESTSNREDKFGPSRHFLSNCLHVYW